MASGMRKPPGKVALLLTFGNEQCAGFLSEHIFGAE
jgi:hypothetical protein